MASDPSAKPKTGLSLYANLLDSSKSSDAGVISRAPVVFKQPGNGDAGSPTNNGDSAPAQKSQISAAALRFQPTKRPQLAAQQKAHKVAQAQAKAAAVAAAIAPPSSTAAPDTQASIKPTAPKTSIADWTGDGDDDDVNFYGEKRQRGGRKKRKKNKQDAPVPQDWDDIYDPSRPNNYEEYKNSDEKIREVREWKDRLYAHRMARRGSYSDSEEDQRPQMNNKFAPPPMSFAPQQSLDEPAPPPPPADKSDDATGDDAYTRRMRMSGQQYQPPPPPPAEVPDDTTGDDAYARRMRMSQQNQTVTPAPLPRDSPPPPPPPPPPPSVIDAIVSKDATSTTISRAPVRYSLPAAPEDIPKSEEELEKALLEEDHSKEEPGEDAPRSSRPGQKGFAARLMSKYGWTKGTGLGASSSGIINPLRVQIEKQKKKSDAEGGGFVGPSGRGKIIGGKKKGGEDHGKFGPMSEVVILRGMLDNMDLAYELGEGNLMQEIGEECGEKYGRVERVFIDHNQSGSIPSIPVFIKFTNQLSALRAVNALEGRIFNGNEITARFYDSEKFADGVYTS